METLFEILWVREEFMEKAKVFWQFLCNEMEYRGFSGVSCNGLKPLYAKMDSEFLHFIPATNENIALGIVAGMNISGIKSGILMRTSNFCNIVNYLNLLNDKYKIPVLLILFEDEVIQFKRFTKVLSMYLDHNYNRKLKKFLEKMEKESVPGILVIREGIIE
jgi:hypothetical protein